VGEGDIDTPPARVAATPRRQVPARIGAGTRRYEFRELLGRGGFGDVDAARYRAMVDSVDVCVGCVQLRGVPDQAGTIGAWREPHVLAKYVREMALVVEAGDVCSLCERDILVLEQVARALYAEPANELTDRATDVLAKLAGQVGSMYSGAFGDLGNRQLRTAVLREELDGVVEPVRATTSSRAHHTIQIGHQLHTQSFECQRGDLVPTSKFSQDSQQQWCEPAGVGVGGPLPDRGGRPKRGYVRLGDLEAKTVRLALAATGMKQPRWLHEHEVLSALAAIAWDGLGERAMEHHGQARALV
jgi:hypothetical protein